jgi:VIT1/CCC1 family predicted Fe2+/Mn2+ transporter
MTTFAFVAASAGAGEGGRAVLAIGFANAVADAFTMGIGEYVSASAERDHALAERHKEEWEVENHFDDELQEVIQAYERRGYAADDARAMAHIVAKDRTRLVEERMLQTFGVVGSDSDVAHGVKQGVVMFLSFILFGIIPLLGYLIHRGRGIDGTFAASCAITGLGLLALGAAKGHLTSQSMPVTSIKMLACGALSGVVSFTLSIIISRSLAEDEAFVVQ